MDAIIITIGDELLIGQVVDTNSAWLGTELNDLGVQVIERISVADDHDAIINALRETVNKAELILLTGGLGPTKDDITKKAIAGFFDDHMVPDTDIQPLNLIHVVQSCTAHGGSQE